jgi:hypothetical protein
MKLTGSLKKQTDDTNNREEKRSLIENAGMMLTEDELDMVSGGWGAISEHPCISCLYQNSARCNHCHKLKVFNENR